MYSQHEALKPIAIHWTAGNKSLGLAFCHNSHSSCTCRSMVHIRVRATHLFHGVKLNEDSILSHQEWVHQSQHCWLHSDTSASGKGPILGNGFPSPHSSPTSSPFLASWRLLATVFGSWYQKALSFALQIHVWSILSSGTQGMGSLPFRFWKWHRSHWKGVMRWSQFCTIQNLKWSPAWMKSPLHLFSWQWGSKGSWVGHNNICTTHSCKPSNDHVC